MIRFRVEPISYAANRNQVLGLGGNILNVAAQAHYKIVDSPSVGVFVEPPDFFEDGFSRHYASGMLDQMPQELRFHQGEVNCVTSTSKF